MPPKFKARRLDRAAVERGSDGFSLPTTAAASSSSATAAASSSSSKRKSSSSSIRGRDVVDLTDDPEWIPGSNDNINEIGRAARSSHPNSTVVPIQLLHEQESGPRWTVADDSSKPALAHFPEAEFEDCSAFIDFDSFLHPTTNVDADFEEEGSVSPSRGKRKAAEREKDKGPLLVSTVCLFHVAPWDASVEGAMKSHLQHPEGNVGGLSLHSDACSQVRVASIKGREAGSVLHDTLQLQDQIGRVALRVPLVDTNRIDVARQPQRFTNGAWLAACDSDRARSASSRSSKEKVKDGEHPHLKISIKASFPRRPIVQPPASTLPSTGGFLLQLHIRVHLHEVAFASSILPSISEADMLHQLMRFACPSNSQDEALRRQTMDESLVYSSLRASQLSDEPPALQPPGLEPSLIPFQRRSVHFILGREGKFLLDGTRKEESGGSDPGSQLGSLANRGQIMTHTGMQLLGLGWEKVDESLYYNALLGIFRRDVSETRADDVRGGILAEEMGLGKTVEVLALILLHPDIQRSSEPSYYDEIQDVQVAPTKTTLIVAPEVLRQQWLDETAVHAPELRIFSYTGYQDVLRMLKKDSASSGSPTSWHDFARQLDVIVVSFDTLRKELNVAKKERPRSRRFERKYERPRSLLVQLAFHRVVMDEVQLVGHSMAAETVSLIARNHSLAVSGTPVKRLSDLQSLFRFLKVPFVGGSSPSSNAYFHRLMTPAMAPQLRQMLGVLATRHTKEQVRHEMSLPLQTRTLVPLNFTAIESTFYRDMYQRTLRSLGLGVGSAGGLSSTSSSSSRQSTATLSQIRQRIAEAGDDSNAFNLARLRGDLLHLRQACTHPQIAAGLGGGERNTLAVSSQIRSMDEVLTVMYEGARAEEASTLLSLHRRIIDRAVLMLQNKENEARHELARASLVEQVRPALEQRVQQVKADLVRAKRIGPLYRFTVDELSSEDDKDNISDGGEEEDAQRQLQRNNAPLGQGQTQAERERENSLLERRAHRHRHMGIVQNRMRSVLEQLHRCKHFLGNICYQMGQLQREKEQKEREQVRERSVEERGHLGKEEGQPKEQAHEQGSQQHPIKTEEKEERNELSKDEGEEESEIKVINDAEVGKKAETTNETTEQPVSAEVAELKRQEDHWYDGAEAVRLELLKESRHIVEGSLRSFDKAELDLETQHRPYVTQHFDSTGSGLTMGASFDRLEALVTLLDANAKVVLQWRRDIVERLRKPVSRDVSAEDEEDDQYQENLDAQAEAEALLEMYRVLLAERELIVTGVTTQGATSKPALMVQLEHSHRLESRRRTARQLRLAHAQVESPQDGVHTPSDTQAQTQAEAFEALEQAQGLTEAQRETERLQLRHFEKLNEQRKTVSLDVLGREHEGHGGAGHFETVLRQLRETSNRVERREEVQLARRAIETIRQLMSQQKTLCERLRREAGLLSNIFNARSAYFKQIQDLSDQVADIETKDVQRDVLAAAKEEQNLKVKVDGIQGRLRYLAALEAETLGGATIGSDDASIPATKSNEEEREGAQDTTALNENGPGRTCIICTEPLIRAVLLGTCGHWTCEDCFQNWTLKRRACPLCKRPVKPNEAHRVTYGPVDGSSKTQQQVPQTHNPIERKLEIQRAQYNVMPEALREEVARQRLQTSLGSKLDLLTRHLLQLQTQAPGIKSLIFTAFSRGVSLVSDALSLNGIRHVRLETGGKVGANAVDQFKNDASVHVLVLHSEAQSSGLNLVCAQHVFLLEPLVNHAMELQAIGRVHRIGQAKETNVWGYAVNETVEERIVEMGRQRKGRSLFIHANSRSTHLRDSASLAAEAKAARGSTSTTTTTTTSTKAKQGEFVASLDDILASLFDEASDERLESEQIERNGAGVLNGSSSIAASTRINGGVNQEDERERLRRERLQAIERRQAMASLEQERISRQ